MARQNCSEKTIAIKQTYNSLLIFITKSDDVRRCHCDHSGRSVLELLQFLTFTLKSTHVIYTMARSSFPHAQKTLIFTTHTLVTIGMHILIASSPNMYHLYTPSSCHNTNNHLISWLGPLRSQDAPKVLSCSTRTPIRHQVSLTMIKSIENSCKSMHNRKI